VNDPRGSMIIPIMRGLAAVLRNASWPTATDAEQIAVELGTLSAIPERETVQILGRVPDSDHTPSTFTATEEQFEIAVWLWTRVPNRTADEVLERLDQMQLTVAQAIRSNKGTPAIPDVLKPGLISWRIGSFAPDVWSGDPGAFGAGELRIRCQART
jgi:hypothetical protein